MSKPTPRADHTLTFQPEYVETIQHGLKTATVRYNDEKDIQTNDVLKCKVPDGTPFARVTVTRVDLAEVRAAPELIRRMGEQHGASDWQELQNTLNEYYHETIHATSVVKVIAFERYDKNRSKEC